MKIKFFSMFDYILLLCVLVLCAFGISFIYSSGIDENGILVSKEYQKQLIWVAIGFMALIITTLFDYRRIKRYAPYGFIALILILIYTRIFGKLVNGAKSWIGIGGLGIQPSELGKILFILFLAWYLERSSNENPRRRFILALLALLLPMALILIQPDLGTASVYLPIFLVMCFMANIPLRYILLVLGTGLLTIFFTVLPIWHSEIWLYPAKGNAPIPAISLFTDIKLFFLMLFVMSSVAIVGLLGFSLSKKRYFFWLAYIFGMIAISLVLSLGAARVMHDYQIKRLIIFLDPGIDPRGAGWNLSQSKIAIGSGGLFGRGFKMGTQSHYRYLPKQSTDFIFSILAEESGFIGCMVVFAVFVILFIRIIRTIRSTTNRYGYFIASGILGMFFFHFIVNVGMDMGLMPITGIPLPFLSYGGSSILTNMISAGLVMSINARRLDFNENVL